MSEISQRNFKRRLALTVALPLLLMSLLAVGLIGQVYQLISALQWLNHTNEVIAQANLTEKLLVDMETGLRGYLVTGNTEFLEPYQKANGALGKQEVAPQKGTSFVAAFDKLTESIADNPSQVQRLKQVRSRYEQWNRYAQQMIALRKQGGDYQSYTVNSRGKQLMDQLRGDIASFIKTEEALRKTRTQTVEETTQFVLVTRIVLFLGAGIILAFFIRRQLIAVAESYRHALAVAQEQAEELRESAVALGRSVQRLASLHEIDRCILAAQSSEVLIRAALSRMRQLVPCQQTFIVLFNFETGTAQVVARSENGESERLEDTTMPLAGFEADTVLQQGTRYVENVAAESCPPALQRLLLEGAGSYITVPLVVEENLIGELNLVATQKAAFAPEHQEIAKEVAAQLAIAIHQSNLRQQLQNYTAQLEQRVADRTQKLQESNAELEAFSYSVSHDLRAPLRTLQGFTQALMEDYSDRLDSIAQDYTRYIVDAAVSMDTLITDLLTYSQLSRAEIQIQPIDLSRVISEALSQLDIELRERKPLVNVTEPLPQVMAHRRTLVQVITNLLSNAIKFIEPDVQPQVRVWAQSRGDSIRLWVVDNGLGIAVEHQERIFRVFERLHGIEAYPGTGIGLAIVRKGMERLGGRVGVESQLGQGSRFWIELPKSQMNGEEWRVSSGE